MERYLVTHSLLTSWYWTLKDNPYETADADPGKLSKMDEFMLTLDREPIPTNEAMQKGIDFEHLVNRAVVGAPDDSHRWSVAAAEVASHMTGAHLQFRANKEATVRGVPVLLYGRFDALKAGVIFDVKYSGSYEVGKYIDSTQHPMYMEICPEAYEFVYLISNGSAVYKETYRRDETQSIYPIIEQFFNWLETRFLMGRYLEKWLAL